MREVIIKSKIVGREGAIGGGKPIAFPNLSAYALRSDFIRLESSFNDFLEGDDTDNVINRWKELEAFLNNISEDYNLLSLLNGKADKATTLSGYGITDAYTKTNVDDLLKSYVTLGGTQTITGEKNFTGGLKVNGSPIVYDSYKKYWKLEGDLLVTGGVTMYGNEGTYTPSTIMDAIAVDGTTISKEGGVLKVIGGTGGGVADSVEWDNITGKPTFASVATSGKYSDLSGTPSSLPASDVYSWAKAANKPSYTWSEITSKPTWIGSSKPTYSYSEITGAISTTELQNYLTSNSYLNVTSGDNRYLKLSGGTLSSDSRSPLTLKSGSAENHSLLLFNRGSDYWGSIGFNSANSLIFKDTNGANYAIWHSGNDGSGSGLNADLLDGKHNGELTASMLLSGGGSVLDANEIKFSDYALRFFSTIHNTSTNFPTFTGYQNGLLALPIHSNGATAQLYFTVGKNPYFRSHHTYEWNELAYKNDNVASATKIQTARTIWGQSFDGTGNVSGTVKTMSGHGLHLAVSDDTYWQSKGIISTSWVSGIGDYTDVLVPSSAANSAKIRLLKDGNVGIGTERPAQKLDVIGNVKADALYLTRRNGSVAFTISEEAGTNGYNIIAGGGTSYIRFYTNYTSGAEERMRIDSYGNLGIGLTIPGAKLHVNGDILAQGGITMYSMRALKNVVDERGLSLEELSSIKPTRYTWKDCRDNRLHFGGIADDIQQVLPEVVYSTSDGILTMDYGNAAFAIASSLIKPIINHEERIALLEEENKQLRQEVERLKSA